MSRNKFAERYGAFGNNVNWNWSWINEKERFVIFGASTVHEAGDVQLILSKDWEKSLKGRKHSGYSQAIRHLERITNDSFKLFTFRQVESDPDPETGNVKMTSFEEELEERSLRVSDGKWFALPANDFEPVFYDADKVKVYLEGSKIPVSGWRIERNFEARKACLTYHGHKCKLCNFDFEAKYGDLGEGYIHVHHVNPISDYNGERPVNPVEHLIPVCPNCHAMIHRGGKTRSVDEISRRLKKKWKKRESDRG